MGFGNIAGLMVRLGGGGGDRSILGSSISVWEGLDGSYLARDLIRKLEGRDCSVSTVENIIIVRRGVVVHIAAQSYSIRYKPL